MPWLLNAWLIIHVIADAACRNVELKSIQRESHAAPPTERHVTCIANQALRSKRTVYHYSLVEELFICLCCVFTGLQRDVKSGMERYIQAQTAPTVRCFEKAVALNDKHCFIVEKVSLYVQSVTLCTYNSLLKMYKLLLIKMF